MSTIKRQQAVNRLRSAAHEARHDDLVEIYNELFPGESIAEEQPKSDSSALVHRITAHIDSGLEVEEILDLWNVIFPTHRDVWFEDDQDLIHYEDKPETVSQVD